MSHRLLGVVLALSIIGAAIAGYLTYTHYDEAALVCTVGSCTTVQQSAYSTLGPVPIALGGVAMYLAVGGLALARLRRPDPRNDERATFVSWTILCAGVAYAAYLTYVELWVIEAVCRWCVASAVVSVVLLGLESLLVWRILERP